MSNFKKSGPKDVELFVVSRFFCSNNVPTMFQQCSNNVPTMFQQCSNNVPFFVFSLLLDVFFVVVGLNWCLCMVCMCFVSVFRKFSIVCFMFFFSGWCNNVLITFQ